MKSHDKTSDKTGNNYMIHQEILEQTTPLIQQALQEDIGDGDVTTLTTVPETAILMGKFIAKQDGVIAGLQVVQQTFTLLNEQVQVEPIVEDGSLVSKGQVVATIKGPGQAILSGERVALNLLQRMSGIASMTRRFVEAISHTSTAILDTRKTAPNLRIFDKWAVKLGGGQNHRFGLFDMVLIKENHIAGAGGSITKTVERVRANDPRQRQIEVEVKNLTELEETLSLKVDRIMLDNMSLAEMSQAVQITAGHIPLEASGNISLERVAEVAATGVDFISVGALTHSVTALDVSLLIE